MEQDKNKNNIIYIIVGSFVIFIGAVILLNSTSYKDDGYEYVMIAYDTIQPRTLITYEMLESIRIPSEFVADNVITSTTLIVGMYSNYNSVIPKGSFFFEETVIEKKDLPNAALYDIEAGEILSSLPVDINTTHGNSILPGDYFNISMKVKTEDGLLIGNLIDKIEVIAVKDSEGRNVFENSEEARIPERLLFALDKNLSLLLRKAGYLTEYEVELIPVPIATKDTYGIIETQIGDTSKELIELIEIHSISSSNELFKDELVE